MSNHNPVTLRLTQVRILTLACLGLGLAVVAVIGGWAVTGTLTDRETLAGGVVFLGLRPGLAVAGLAAPAVFAVAWASLSGLLEVAAPVEVSHLSYNAPVISVILLFCVGLTGYAVEAYQKR